MGDQVSNNNDFDSRYFDVGDEAPARAADGGFDDSAGDFARDFDERDETTVTTNLHLSSPRPAGGGGDDEEPQFARPDADVQHGPHVAGGGAPGQRVSVPDHYWNSPAEGPGGRHGHVEPPPVAGPGRMPGSSGPVWAPWEKGDVGRSEGCHVPGGPRLPAQPPPVSGPSGNGPGYLGGPPQRGPQQPDYGPPPGLAYPGGAGGGAPGYPPGRPDAYLSAPGAGARSRRAAGADDRSDASVGDLRAQIRESHVAPLYKPVPKMGWRKTVYRTTRINMGLSADERHWNDLYRRLKVNLRGNYVIAVFGEKGGVTKTTVAIGLGMALKKYRDEKIVAIDANPASGNLSRRIQEPSTLSWRGFVRDEGLRQYSDFRQYMGKDPDTGLDVLASDRGDDVLTGANLVEAWRRLQVQYPIAIIDCGNQMRDDIIKAILDELPVDAIVVPSTTRLDGAKGAADTLNWLMEHGYPHLVRQAVVVVSNVNNINASAQVRGLHEDFDKAVRAVHDVPFDQHLSDATAIEFWRMRPETQKAYIEAAASLVDGFAGAADRKASAGGWADRGGQR
ncbi:nucleotide-binding protein [Mycobacterium kansasii]